jgi:hypothetical protein
VSVWNGCIDGVRVDRTDEGYTAGHPEMGTRVITRDCGWLAAWHVARSVRVMREFGLRKEDNEQDQVSGAD